MSLAGGRPPAITAIGEFDVCLDLSDSGLDALGLVRHLEYLRGRSGLVADGRRLTLSPPGPDPTADRLNKATAVRPAAAALQAAIADAALLERGLVVVKARGCPRSRPSRRWPNWRGSIR